MPSLIDSCRITGGLPINVTQLARDQGLPFPVSLRKFVRTCPYARCVRLHLKWVQPPGTFTGPASTSTVDPLTKLLQMRNVYRTADLGVEIGTRQTLPSEEVGLLSDLDVGVGRMPPQQACDGDTTAAQNDLFDHRDGARDDDVVVYFVRSTNPSFNGCATHPAGRPGAAVADVASQWTLAHEVGHVLGLPHIDTTTTCDLTRLMTGCGTGLIPGFPVLVGDEIDTMRSSPFTHDPVR